MQHEEGTEGTEGPVKVGPFKLTHENERKLVLVGVGVSVLGLLLLVMANRKGSPAVVGNDGLTATGLPPAGSSGSAVSGEQLLMEELKVAGMQIEHSAQFGFTIDSSALSHDMGSHKTSGGGSAGLSIGPFSFGGDGHKEGEDTWDLMTTESLNAGLGGSNLSESEFDLMVQLAQTLANDAHRAELDAYDAASKKLDRYKPVLTPHTAPNHGVGIYTPQGVLYTR